MGYNSCFDASVKWSVSKGWQEARRKPQGHRELKLQGWPNKHLTEMIIITSGEAALGGPTFSHRKQICSYIPVIWTLMKDTAHSCLWETCISGLAFVCLSSIVARLYTEDVPPSAIQEAVSPYVIGQFCSSGMWSIKPKDSGGVMRVSCSQD